MLGTLPHNLPQDILYEISLNFSLVELTNFFGYLDSSKAKHLVESLSFWIHYLKHHYRYIVGEIDIYKIIPHLAGQLVSNYEGWTVTKVTDHRFSSFITFTSDSTVYQIFDFEKRIALLPDIMTFVDDMVKGQVKTRKPLIPLMSLPVLLNMNKFKELSEEYISNDQSNPSVVIDYKIHMDEITMGRLRSVLMYVGWMALDHFLDDSDERSNAPLKLDYETIRRALYEYLEPENREWGFCFFDDNK